MVFISFILHILDVLVLTYAEGVAKGVFTPDVFSYAN